MVRRGNLVLMIAGVVILVATGFSTQAAVRWLSDRTTLNVEFVFVRGVRPDFAFSNTVNGIVERAKSGELTQIRLEVAPPDSEDQAVIDAELDLAQRRLDAVITALRSEGLDQTGVPVSAEIVDPVSDADPRVVVRLERMAP